MKSPQSGGILLIAIFGAAICGLVYELIGGALSSYLIGDSITQFSLVIGVFLSAMGVGSYLSRFCHHNLLGWLVGIELSVGAIGGFTALIGFLAFAHTTLYVPILLSLMAIIGALVGAEIPLVIRILQADSSLRVTLANVLGVDYIGALVASLIFPFILVPFAGLIRGGIIMGLFNVVIGIVILRIFKEQIRFSKALGMGGAVLIVVLGTTGIASGDLTTRIESSLYQDSIVYAKDTRYQRAIITRWRDDIRLYLNGHLQFSSVDEYRYHEALVHPALSLHHNPKQVLILGGGDGLAAREILRYPTIERVDLVDLDGEITSLFRDNELLQGLNRSSLSDKRVTIRNEDAMRFLENASDVYDIILMDLPDPSTTNLSKLYSRTFFSLVGRRLAPEGILCTQATSPYRSRKAFWAIVTTMEAARWGPAEVAERFRVAPFHVMIPTFGTWGFVMASKRPLSVDSFDIGVMTQYVTSELAPSFFVFPPDMSRVDVPVSSLNDPVVVQLYRDGYHQYLE